MRTLEYSTVGVVSRRRRKCLAWTVAAILFLALAYYLFTPRGYWSGGAVPEVRLHVYDAVTRQPIAGATVRQLSFAGIPMRTVGQPPAPTDAAGRTIARIFAGAGGERGLILDRYSFGDTDNPLEIAASGYQTAKVFAGEKSSFRIFGKGPRAVLDVDVPMTRAPTTTPATQ